MNIEHNLASELHWNSSEIAAARRTSWVSLGSWSPLNYQSNSAATNKLSREETGMRVTEWKTGMKCGERCMGENKKVHRAHMREQWRYASLKCDSVTDHRRCVRSRSQGVKQQHVNVTTANICFLSHGASGSADIPIYPLSHWSKLAFMRPAFMQFIAVLNKAPSVYNQMLFP